MKMSAPIQNGLMHDWRNFCAINSATYQWKCIGAKRAPIAPCDGATLRISTDKAVALAN
jgi:hypothetical protein